MLIECSVNAKNGKVYFIEVGLTRKRWKIVNEKRHVQKRACESARMLCLHRFFSCHKLHAYFHVRRFQFPFSYPWRVVASICSRSSKSGQIEATSERLLMHLQHTHIVTLVPAWTAYQTHASSCFRLTAQLGCLDENQEEKQCELWKPCCAVSAEEVICLDALALAGADLLLLLFNIDFIDNLKSIESEEQRPNIYIRASLKAGRVRTGKKRSAQTYMIIRSLRRPILPPITLDVGCSLLTNCAEQASKQAARLNH
ncbi:hypothetical protein T11_12144 [Trichinella zimbabwensis]|uniref:Uncharacterized protein n=1 Tax=Trichinella zimbabwensis TaxID=268475 RepID=A0A0V1HYN9_9BILA|nr:hypothetical protein T11_12144 [Trichinella zimbabwensis]